MATAKYKRNKDGIFATKAWDGTYNPDGTKHRIHLKSKKSSRDLENQVNALREKVESGQNRKPTDWLFQDYARHWLEVKKSVREKNTRTMYDNIVEKHFGFMAEVRLCNVCHSHFDQAIANASDKPRTCQIIYITFCQIMRMAVSDHFITKDDYEHICGDISLPKYKRAEKRPLNELEKNTLKACFDTDVFTPRERAFLTLIYYCGLRKGEALALTRFDFTFSKDGNYVHINRALIFDKNTPEFKDFPKTDHGVRSVPVPLPAAEFLKRYISSLPGTNLFYCATCSMITKSSYDKMWKSIINKMNLAAGGTPMFPLIDDLTAHIFRHNYCTSLCYEVPEISIKKVAQLMGDTIAVAMNVYNHVVEEKENVTEVLEDALAI